MVFWQVIAASSFYYVNISNVLVEKELLIGSIGKIPWFARYVISHEPAKNILK